MAVDNNGAFHGLTEHEQALCVGDALASLQLIVARKGAPIHITELPISLASGMWLFNQRFFTSLTVDRRKFRMLLTSAGIEFLRSHSIDAETSLIAIDSFKPEPHQALEFDHVFVQHKNGRINEFWDLDALPAMTMDTLKMGMLAVHNGELYSISEAHILGQD